MNHKERTWCASANLRPALALTELLVTMAILMTGGAVAVMNITGAVRGSHVATAYQNTLNQLRFARQIAIDKRTVCRVDFVAPGTISVTQAFADGTPAANGNHYLAAGCPVHNRGGNADSAHANAGQSWQWNHRYRF